MGWLGSLWAWVAEHPVTVIGATCGLVAIVVMSLTAYWRRKRKAEAVLYKIEPPELAGAAGYEPEPPSLPSPASAPAPPRRQKHGAPGGSTASEEPVVLASFASEGSRRPDPSTPQGALAIEAGRLAYQIPKLMWRGVQETVEVRLGQREAEGLMQGFVGRGSVRTEETPIVETMSVSLVCEPRAFDIEPRSQEVQLVKPDLVKGTAFHQADFAKWMWLVTPRQSGEHTLLVKVSAAIRDSRGLPTTSSLPDKIIEVAVRVHLARAAAGAVMRAVPATAGAVATALVGIFTRDYWWPYVRDIAWPAVRAFAGMQ
jgi:hypothetical protein